MTIKSNQELLLLGKKQVVPHEYANHLSATLDVLCIPVVMIYDISLHHSSTSAQHLYNVIFLGYSKFDQS